MLSAPARTSGEKCAAAVDHAMVNHAAEAIDSANPMPAGLAAWGCDEALWGAIRKKKGLLDLLKKGKHEQGRERIKKLRELVQQPSE